MAGGCLAFHYSAPSFQFSYFLPHRSHISLPPISLFKFLILLPPSYPFLECRRRGAAGRLRRCLGSRGGGYHARDRAGSRGLPPKGPARALPRPGPHAPNLRRATGRRGRVKPETEETLKVGFAVVTEADGDGKSGPGPPFMERPSGGPSGGLGSGLGVSRV